MPMKEKGEEEKSDVQKTVLKLTGKKLLTLLGKPNASDADVMQFSELLDEFQEACRFYRYGG